MGAKAPEKLKLRRQSCKCEVCGRKFLNISALTSHRKFVHKTTPMNTKRMPVKKPPDLQNIRVVKKRIANRSDSKISTQIPSTKAMNKNNSKVSKNDSNVSKNDSYVSKNDSNVSKNVSNNKKTVTKKRIEFKCPKCVKVFSVYFSAYRHIQKNHCVDKNDQPIPPNSSDLIRPIRVEMFDCCNKFLPISEEHVCTEKEEGNIDRYMCLGCQKTFDSLVLFEEHVKVLHTYRADCLFFPNKDEFEAWKTELEAVTKVKFQTMAPSAATSKQIYHCSHQPSIYADKTLLCPSSLNVTEFNNGCQVFYLKEHFGHTCLDLPPVKYKKYTILPFLKDIDIQHVDSDEHFYQRFKSIVNNISVSAAKADMDVLRSLLGTALAMTLVLNNMEHKEDQIVVNKSMSDDQITKVLSEQKTYPAKRKAETVKKDVKLNKSELENNENIKIDSSINKPVLNKSVVKKPVELPPTPLKKPLIHSSPSFNDTYKDFVDQNFKSVVSDTSTPKKQINKKKAVVKTRMGQFKVRTSLSPKGVEPPSPTPIKDKPEDSPKITKPTLSPKITRPSLSPKETQLNILAKRTRPSLSPKRPKPAVSPKISKPTPVKNIEYKLKPDFKYEVKEQENDCNILILKI